MNTNERKEKNMSRKKKCINCNDCNAWAKNLEIDEEIPERCENCPFYDDGEYECITTYTYNEDEKMWDEAFFEDEYDENYRQQNDIDWLIEKLIESKQHFETVIDEEIGFITISYENELGCTSFAFDMAGEIDGIAFEKDNS
jgi:hypothetical protein